MTKQGGGLFFCGFVSQCVSSRLRLLCPRMADCCLYTENQVVSNEHGGKTGQGGSQQHRRIHWKIMFLLQFSQTIKVPLIRSVSSLAAVNEMKLESRLNNVLF